MGTSNDEVIDIPITEEELNELLFEDKRFNWDFDGIKVCLFKREEDDTEKSD